MERSQEIYKDVPGYDGMYQISNYGNLKSFYRYPEGRIKKPKVCQEGYYSYHLHSEGKYQSFRAHRLVAAVFMEEAPSPDLDIDHIDGDKSNNYVGNLQWCERRWNVQKSQSYPILCEHISGEKLIGYGTRDAAEKTGATRYRVMLNLQNGKITKQGWTYKKQQS